MRYAAVLLAHAVAMAGALVLGEPASEVAVWSWSAVAAGAGLLVLSRAPGRWRPALATLAPLGVIATAIALSWLPWWFHAVVALALAFAVSLVVAVLYWLIALVRWAARGSRARPSPAARGPAATAAR